MKGNAEVIKVLNEMQRRGGLLTPSTPVQWAAHSAVHWTKFLPRSIT